MQISKRHELTWKIDAYKAETMPLERLLEYLDHLSGVLGEARHMHLIDVKSGSTVPVFKVDAEAYPRVIERAIAVTTGLAPANALRSYRCINRMLKADNGKATLLQDGGAEIIPFPGRDEPEGLVSGIGQIGNLTGTLQKIGGAKEWVPIHLRTFEEDTITGCFARKAVAKQLCNHLFDPVRLHGRGRWSRTHTGEWELDRFYVDTFEIVQNEPLPHVLAELRAAKVQWLTNDAAITTSNEG
jgi:hypothetical protein